jgi:hypothetical protein
MASLESLERTLGRFQRHDLKVLESEEERAPVTPVDLIRLDQYGRTMIACPAGTAPHSWLELSGEEEKALVPADQGPKPKVLTGPYGFDLNSRHRVASRYA